MRQWYATRPPGDLAGLLSRISGYRLEGFAPGVHVGMPSPALTLVVAVGPPLLVSAGAEPPRPYAAVAAGLHARPVSIHHDGTQQGIQLDLTPAGARALLGRPASELCGRMVELSELLAPADRFLAEQVADTPSWSDRLDLVLGALTRRLDATRPARAEVAHAWEQVCRTHGGIPVAAVARSVGWSTRHLGDQFRAEYGLGPKTAARVARFDRAHTLVAARRASLADIAARCGYADQAHLHREWREFAGTTPTRWIRDDQLAFVHDDRPAPPPG